MPHNSRFVKQTRDNPGVNKPIYAYHLAYRVRSQDQFVPSLGILNTAKFFCHIRRYYIYTSNTFLFDLPVLFEEAAQRQEIIDPKCRSARRDAIKGVSLNNVCHVGHQGFKLAAGVVIEDPVLAPGEFPGHQLVLRTAKGMERMDDPKSTYAVAGTSCI